MVQVAGSGRLIFPARDYQQRQSATYTRANVEYRILPGLPAAEREELCRQAAQQQPNREAQQRILINKVYDRYPHLPTAKLIEVATTDIGLTPENEKERQDKISLILQMRLRNGTAHNEEYWKLCDQIRDLLKSGNDVLVRLAPFGKGFTDDFLRACSDLRLSIDTRIRCARKVSQQLVSDKIANEDFPFIATKHVPDTKGCHKSSEVAVPSRYADLTFEDLLKKLINEHAIKSKTILEAEIQQRVLRPDRELPFKISDILSSGNDQLVKTLVVRLPDSLSLKVKADLLCACGDERLSLEARLLCAKAISTCVSEEKTGRAPVSTKKDYARICAHNAAIHSESIKRWNRFQGLTFKELFDELANDNGWHDEPALQRVLLNVIRQRIETQSYRLCDDIIDLFDGRNDERNERVVCTLIDVLPDHLGKIRPVADSIARASNDKVSLSERTQRICASRAWTYGARGTRFDQIADPRN